MVIKSRNENPPEVCQRRTESSASWNPRLILGAGALAEGRTGDLIAHIPIVCRRSKLPALPYEGLVGIDLSATEFLPGLRAYDRVIWPIHLRFTAYRFRTQDRCLLLGRSYRSCAFAYQRNDIKSEK